MISWSVHRPLMLCSEPTFTVSIVAPGWRNKLAAWYFSGSRVMSLEALVPKYGSQWATCAQDRAHLKKAISL